MAKRVGFTGDEAVAYAVKQCDVDVVAAYPITPQTIIVEAFSRYVYDGEVKTEYVCVESEHSAMSACIGASLTGARAFTATASQGLALMHEMLYIASGMRLPIVMAVANRALSAPLNIHCDHSDMMGSRDCGWIQVYAESVQEAYDWTVQAFKVAEHPQVQLPVAVCLDGFTVTHCMEGMEVLEDAEVRGFLPPRDALYRLDPDRPLTFGAWMVPAYYMDLKYQQNEALKQSLARIEAVGEEYASVSGRRYGSLETYGLEDAEAAVLCLGGTAGTARTVAEKLRGEGKKVGVIKLWVYRPFPTDQLAEAVRGLKALAVMDRACSFGAPYGPLCADVRSAIQAPNLQVFNVVYGLGGRDVGPRELEALFEETLSTARMGRVEKPVRFMGVDE
ncbi:MAG: pyruvate ferredoxin oxidoreductase [Candidatus Bathyarchaeia archaeon]